MSEISVELLKDAIRNSSDSRSFMNFGESGQYARIDGEFDLIKMAAHLNKGKAPKW